MSSELERRRLLMERIRATSLERIAEGRALPHDLDEVRLCERELAELETTKPKANGDAQVS